MFKGSVESFSLADVFQNLAMNQQTGTLRVFTPEGELKHVFFQNGHVQYLSRGQGKPLVAAEVFLARGYIDPLQLEQTLQQIQQAPQPAGSCLVSLGGITPEQLDEVTQLQIEEEIYDLFGWEKANFEFEDGPAVESLYADQVGGKTPALPISHLIMEAARRVDEWERLRKQIPSFKEIYYMEGAAQKAIEKGEMETTPIERRIASLLDGTRDADDVVHDSCLFPFEVLNTLAGFIQQSLVRPATAQELAPAEQECLRRNLPRRRIKVLERILALSGENARVRRELADCLARDEQVEKACIHFTVLAEAELAAKNEDGAVEQFRRILSLSPKHVKAHEKLATIYAKRGQKREAFVHYHELFETFRDQNHMNEARAAAVAALECDPAHADLRAALIELFLADNQKEAAAQQLEVQGDQAARQGTVKTAADSYRRAMQLAPLNKQLKKKLADVMLSKEDRVARKRQAVVALAVIALMAAVAGALALLEHLNAGKFADAEHQARLHIDAAVAAERTADFGEAGKEYDQAAAAYFKAKKLLSPMMRYDQRAEAEAKRLSDLAAAAKVSLEKHKDDNIRKAELDFLGAENALKARPKKLKEAIELCGKVLKNPHAEEAKRKTAAELLENTQKLLDDFKKAMERLKRPPDVEWGGDVQRESVDKRRIIEDYQAVEGFPPLETIEFPLLVRTDTDGVSVFKNGALVGSVKAGGGEEAKAANTFRYPAVGNHKFDFRKTGYKTVAITTERLPNPVFDLKMLRQPFVELDLRAVLGDASVSGEPIFDDVSKTFLVGSSEGSLLQVREDGTLAVPPYKFAGGAALHREATGPAFIYTSRDGQRLFIFCTKGGGCVALKLGPAGFQEAWKHSSGGVTSLSAPPALVKNSLLPNPVVAMPAGKTMILVDCEKGGLAAESPRDFKAQITSAAIGADPDLILAGGTEGARGGKLYGLALRSKTRNEWDPGLAIGELRGMPVKYEGEILIGGDDGKLYLFKPSNPGARPERIELNGGGAITSEPLIVRNRLFVGTVDKEGFFSADLSRKRALAPFFDTDMGGVAFRPAILHDTVYFGTDKGRLYAVGVDGEKMQRRWSYQVEGARPILGSPLINGRRVYIVVADGRIIGFEE